MEIRGRGGTTRQGGGRDDRLEAARHRVSVAPRAWRNTQQSHAAHFCSQVAHSSVGWLRGMAMVHGRIRPHLGQAIRLLT